MGHGEFRCFVEVVDRAIIQVNVSSADPENIRELKEYARAKMIAEGIVDG